MTTKTLNTTEHIQNPSHSVPGFGLLRSIGRLLLGLIALLLLVLIVTPVVLLLFVTSVPLFITFGLLTLDAGFVFALFRAERTLLTMVGATVGFVAVSIVAVYASQVFASTPAIDTPGSIATLEQVELNGSQQWVTIRGHSTDLPVLLFLAGGPGGSELAMTRRYLGDLEEHFIVVNWDQPGTGKSYSAVAFDELTPERYVEDGYALVQHLRERFQQERIYVFGESWGSILGVWLVQQHPDLFHALVSTGQMVAPVENDILMYEFAVEQATAQGRTGTLEQLRRNGPPPYTRSQLIGRFGTMNAVVDGYMGAHAHGEGTGHNLVFDSMRAPEYGLVDKVTWALGLARTFTTVYPQIYDVDLRTQAHRLEVPAYFIVGRWDRNAIPELAEEYFNMLEAPHKQFFWFENSAHTPMWDEPARFLDVMVNTVLAQTQPPAPDTSTFSGYFDTKIPGY